MLALVSVCLLPGCLEFKNQSLSYHYDKKSDTLRIFQVYRGIFAADPIEKKEAGELISGTEKEQLVSVLNGQRTFFFSNWITEYNRADYKTMQAGLKTVEGRKEMESSPEGLATMENLLTILLSKIHIENGPFYFDSNKQLSGVQYVTVTNCSSVFAAINDFTPYFIKGMMDDEGASDDERAALATFSKTSQPIIKLEANGLTLRWPASRTEYDESFGVASGTPEEIAERVRAGLKTSFSNDTIIFEIGNSDDTVSNLTLNVSNKPYNKNLADFVRSQHPLRDSLDVSAAAREFLLHGKQVRPGDRQ